MNFMKNLAVAILAGLSLVAATNVDAMSAVISYDDPAGTGFNDPTLGAMRKAAFQATLNIWTSQLQGSVPLSVSARFESMGGDASSAILAYAGPVSAISDFGSGAPNTWYSVALANQLSGMDQDPTAPDIEVVVNSDVDNPDVLGSIGFYYGLDGFPGNDVDFRSTILHELGHGLGFLSFADNTTGDFLQATGDSQEQPDIFSSFLVTGKSGAIKVKGGKHPKTIIKAKSILKMRPKQRLKAFKSMQLRWNGANVNAAKGFLVPMYAPSVIEEGSSVSHWDTSNYPNLLMEPFDTGPKSDIDLTKQALEDIGWGFNN